MGHVQVVRARTVITPDRELRDGWVAVRGDRIVEVGVGVPPGGTRGAAVPGETAGAAGPGATFPVVIPGLVDLHNHGGGGGAFTDGPEAALAARDAHLRQGTTTLVASLVTDTLSALVEQVRALAPLVHSGELAGIHLEGPWLSPAWCGAHPPDLLADPDLADVAALAAAAGDALVMVTLAPERAGALAATRWLRDRGVRVAVGHTDATYDQTRAVLDAGATVATHLYNAARPPRHREPGPSVALLEDPRVFVESIVDGVHLHPAVVRATARAAGDRWMMVTDAMAAALLGDGTYPLGTLAVEVVDGVARVQDGTALAGSTLDLARAVRTAVGCGVPVVAAVRAATAAPASAMGWSELGRLEPGARADLVVLGEDLRVREVMRGGRWVDRAPRPGPWPVGVIGRNDRAE